MKKSELKQLIKEVLTEGDKSFYRLPKTTIGNQFYSTMKKLNSLYDFVKNDNDFDPETLKSIIGELNKILNSAKKFDYVEDVDPKLY